MRISMKERCELGRNEISTHVCDVLRGHTSQGSGLSNLD